MLLLSKCLCAFIFQILLSNYNSKKCNKADTTSGLWAGLVDSTSKLKLTLFLKMIRQHSTIYKPEVPEKQPYWEHIIIFSGVCTLKLRISLTFLRRKSMGIFRRLNLLLCFTSISWKCLYKVACRVHIGLQGCELTMPRPQLAITQTALQNIIAGSCPHVLWQGPGQLLKGD